MHLPTGLPLPININRRIDNKDYLDSHLSFSKVSTHVNLPTNDMKTRLL